MGSAVVVGPDQVTDGVLIDSVPRDAVDEVVAVCGRKERRSDGKLLAHVTVYLTLGLCLFPDDDYEEVAAKVTGSLDRFGCWDAGWSAPTASAITQARKRRQPLNQSDPDGRDASFDAAVVGFIGAVDVGLSCEVDTVAIGHPAA